MGAWAPTRARVQASPPLPPAPLQCGYSQRQRRVGGAIGSDGSMQANGVAGVRASELEWIECWAGADRVLGWSLCHFGPLLYAGQHANEKKA